MIWLAIGLVVGALYGLIWALMFTAGESDARSVEAWERQQAEWRGDFE